MKMDSSSSINDTISRLTSGDRGIMACDESPRSMGRRFSIVGVEPTAENRRNFFSMLFGADSIEEAINGIILYEDLLDGTSESQHVLEPLIQKDIAIGVRADSGSKDLPGYSPWSYTYGLDGLSERLDRFADLGARFLKWRAAFSVNDGAGQDIAANANSVALALYALTALEHGLVPIVEVEVEIEGAHSAQACGDLTGRVLDTLYKVLRQYGVDAGNTILKTNFVIAGRESNEPVDRETAAALTLDVLKATVPHNVPMIAFLSGGLPSSSSIALLNQFRGLDTPWQATFSFGCALWKEPLELWRGQNANVDTARLKLQELAKSSAGLPL